MNLNRTVPSEPPIFKTRCAYYLNAELTNPILYLSDAIVKQGFCFKFEEAEILSDDQIERSKFLEDYYESFPYESLAEDDLALCPGKLPLKIARITAIIITEIKKPLAQINSCKDLYNVPCELIEIIEEGNAN